MKKIIITGVAGFIASNLAHWILENTNHAIIGLDNLSTGFVDNMPVLSERFIFLEVDVCHAREMEFIFNHYKPDICFHLAAYAAEARSNKIRSFNHTNNTVGTANIINACVNHKVKLVFTSSVAVYSGTPPFTEEMTPKPIDEYGVSKYASEQSIQIAGEQQGLEWCIIRPRNLYGERQSLWDGARNVMGIWMNKILDGEPMVIFGSGKQTRAFTYIGDILEPLYKSAFVANEIINLGAEKTYSVAAACKVLIDIVDDCSVTFAEARHEIMEAYCAIDKSQKLLLFQDKTDLKTGLTKMWQWAQQQPRREPTPMPELEIK